MKVESTVDCCENLNLIFSKKASKPLEQELKQDDPESMLADDLAPNDDVYVFWCVDQDKITSETIKIVQANAYMLKKTRAIMIINE